MTDPILDRAAAVAALGLTVEAVFVPFSQSRNRAEKSPSLNWRITVKRNGREVLTTDYSAGMGHCPGYQVAAPPYGYRAPDRRRSDGKPYPGTASCYRSATPAEALNDYRSAICAAECEAGVAMTFNPARDAADFTPRRVRPAGATASAVVPIMPDPLDVLYSLTMDSTVLDAGGFEDWAADLGYDQDSRAAEAIYRACLEIALKLRGALGDSGMATLRDIFEEF